MLIVALVFIFFAILAVVYELHIITERLIEIGTIVEHFNRRDLRASGIRDAEENDFASESINKIHRTWRQTFLGILIASVVCIVVIKLLASFAAH
jgi:hypothetical protein